MGHHDSVEEILSAASPAVSNSSADLDTAIRHMSARAARESGVRRRIGRPIAAGVAAVLVLGSGVSAAAAATWQWHPWAETPDASFTVVFPSGVTCEYRFGDVQGASVETNEAVRSFVAENDVVALADIDGAVAEARAAGQTIYDEDNVLQPAGPGSPMYNADFEYQLAFSAAVNELITEHLRAEGILEFYDYAMQGNCDGGAE